MGQVQTWTWDANCQSPLTSVDANGLVTSFAYDFFCREISKTLPDGHVIGTAYRNFGDPDAQYIEVNEDSAASGAPIKFSRNYFDGLGETYKTARTGTTITYDLRNNPESLRFGSGTVETRGYAGKRG